MSIFRNKTQQPARLYKKTTFKVRLEEFLVRNQMWLLLWSVIIGSVSTALIMVLIFLLFANPTIGGIL